MLLLSTLPWKKSETSAKNKTWNHRSKRFHEHSIVDLGVLEDLSTGYRKDPGRGLRNGHELGKWRSRCPQKVDFDGSLGSRRESTLGTFASSAETTDSTGV